MRNSRRSSADCAQQPPDGCATDRTTEPTAENTIGTLPPRRPGASPGSPGHPNYPEYPEHPEHPGAAPPPDCNRRTGKGRISEGSPFCFGAENGTRTRAARERFRELWQTPPAPGRGVLRSQVPSPSCTGIQNKKGRTFWILPSCFGAENGTRTRDLNLGKVALYQLSYFRIFPRRTTSERSLTRVLGLQI